MSEQIVRTEEEIESVLSEIESSKNLGSKYKGITYEEGMEAMYLWLTGQIDAEPMED